VRIFQTPFGCIDGWFAALGSGTDSFDPLLVDRFGALADPFGTAPGSVSLGAATDPTLDFTFDVDLSSQIGETVTLFFDLIQEDDGFLFDPGKDNSRLTPSSSDSEIARGTSLDGLRGQPDSVDLKPPKYLDPVEFEFGGGSCLFLPGSPPQRDFGNAQIVTVAFAVV
jgi:hypothetical protein